MLPDEAPWSNKAELRSFLKERRHRYVSEHKSEFLVDYHAAPVLFRVAARGGCIGGYVSTKFEADPHNILADLAERGAITALPHIAHRQASMEFRKWRVNDALERAPFGFHQPLETTECAVPNLILVPLLGFDRDMNRLGQGAGHYDRYFSNNINSLKVGIAFSIQEVSRIPIDDWDVRLDAVLTEKEWIVGSNARIAI